MADKKERRSLVWDYFKVMENDHESVQCDLCHNLLSYKGSSTGTMRNHLKFKHKIDMKSEREPPSHRQGKTADGTRSSEISLGRCHRKLGDWLARDLRPVSVVEDKGFKDFMAEAAPMYPLPSKLTVRRYIHLEYSSKRDVLKVLVKNTPVALTTDMWSSAANEGYITCTAHFIDSQWISFNFVLATRKMDTMHTGQNIAQELRSIVHEYDIQDSQVVALVTDNAANMYTCAKELGWPHYPCFFDSLQQSLGSGLEEVVLIKNAVAAGRRVAAYFCHSALASAELSKRQKLNNFEQTKLTVDCPVDCPTGWNSTYLMIDRLIEQRLAIYAVLMDASVIKKSDAAALDMTDQAWAIMENVMPALRPFYKATTIMSNEEYPPLSATLPVLFSLVNNHLKITDTDMGAISQFKAQVTKYLKDRYGMDSPNPRTLLAVFLDPRFKRLVFVSEALRESVHAESLERIKALTLSEPVPTTTDMSPAQSASVLASSDLEYLLGEEYQQGADCSVVKPKSVKEELAMYLEAPTAPAASNPLVWWHANQMAYPRLAQLARSFLCIPGTEIPSNRVFSSAGGSVSKRRTLLQSDTVDKLIFLHKYVKQQKRSQVSEPQSDEPVISVKVEPVDRSTPMDTGVLQSQPPLPDTGPLLVKMEQDSDVE